MHNRQNKLLQTLLGRTRFDGCGGNVWSRFMKLFERHRVHTTTQKLSANGDFFLGVLSEASHHARLSGVLRSLAGAYEQASL
jgi:hypothetical protein